MIRNANITSVPNSCTKFWLITKLSTFFIFMHIVVKIRKITYYGSCTKQNVVCCSVFCLFPEGAGQFIYYLEWCFTVVCETNVMVFFY